MEALRQLQDWYRDRCDGDWEQAYGLTIETIDQPGWRVEIDVEETPAERLELAPVRERRGPDDWFEIRLENNVFHATGGPGNLADIVARFLAWIAQADA